MFAGRGVREHGEVAIEAAEWYAGRQASYARMMDNIQRSVVAVLKAEKEESIGRWQ